MSPLFKLGIITLLLFESTALFAQLGRAWPYSANYPYTLKGPVKSWEMTGENGLIRVQTFSKDGQLTKDECTITSGQSTSKTHLPFILKKELEAPVSASDTSVDKRFSYVLNEHAQLVEKRSKNSVYKSVFNADGQILINKQRYTVTQTRAWNSAYHEEPTYTFTDTIDAVTIFKYNDLGGLIDFQHHENNMDNSYRVTYRRDSANQVIERLTYESNEIAYNKDDSATRISKAAVDSTFDLNQLIPYFWNAPGSSPLKETYAYNDKGHQIGYTCHCLRTNNAPFESFKAQWVYDEEGKIVTETQYLRHEYHQNYWTDAELEYDAFENIVKETMFYGGQTYVFTYAIEYWQ